MPQGRRFGKYLLHEKLAVGGMGELYLATTVGAAKGTPPSVLKILLPEYSSDADFVSMFHDEARLGMQLSHSNIVVVQDLGRVQDTPFLVMEYVHGENLRNVARRLIDTQEKFPPEIAVRIAIEVLHGLEYAHNAADSRGRPINLVHRDLSPDNVMLSFDGDVKILDFGIAKAEGRATQTQFGILKGKAQYMAPEQALGQGVDGRTDLYAVGLVLLEVITGERRFAAETDPIQQIRDARTWCPTEPSANDPSLPVELDAILLKSMQIEPRRRFQRASEFAAALTSLLKSGSLQRNGENLPRLMRRLYPDRAEPFLLFEEDSSAPRTDTRDSPPPPAAPSEPSIEIIEGEGTEGSAESTQLGGFLGGTGANTPNPDNDTTQGGVRPRAPSNVRTKPPASVRTAAARSTARNAIGAIDDDRPTTNSADEPTNTGYAPPGLDDPTSPGDDTLRSDLDDRTAIGTRPPPPSRRVDLRPASRDDTVAPTRRREPTPPPPPPAPKFREAPPPPPAKFRDVKNLRDFPEPPSASDLLGDEEYDGTRVAPGGQGASFPGASPPPTGSNAFPAASGRAARVSSASSPPSRIVERRRNDAAFPTARPRKRRGIAGRLFLWFTFLVLFASGIGAGLLQSGRLPPEVTARFEPLFAAVPALRPKARGTPIAVAGSGGQLAMVSSPTPAPDPVPSAAENGGDDDDDEVTGRLMTGGGVFPGGDDDDDDAATAPPVTTPEERPTRTPAPQPSRTAVVAATPRPATPRPTREVVAATPRPTAVVSTEGKAMVKVISTPAGLEILVDGQGTGKKTPATVHVEPGTRTIGLKADGFRPWSFKETFVAGDTLQLPVDLQPL